MLRLATLSPLARGNGPSASHHQTHSGSANSFARKGHTTQLKGGNELLIHGVPAARVGEIAAANALVLHSLSTDSASLEDAYLELTHGEIEYVAA